MHSNQVAAWKKQAVEGMSESLSDGRKRAVQEEKAHEAKLYQQIGQLQFELDWLKKNLGSVDCRRELVEPGHAHLSVTRQCDLLGLSRSSYYYEARSPSERDLRQMRLIDEEYTRHPFRGSRRMRDYLEEQGEPACRDRVRHLMQRLGLQAIYPKKRLSLENKVPEKYPYLLRGLVIDRLWRSVKYEEVYLKEYASVRDCRTALSVYFEFYNHARRHQALGRRTPWDVYRTGV